MSSSIREWLNLSVRWFHVFAGIMWSGRRIISRGWTPVRKNREESAASGQLRQCGCAQRRLLHRRETKVARRGAGTGPLVSLGSVDDVAERLSSTRSFVLPGDGSSIRTYGHSQAGGIAIGLGALAAVGSSTIWLCAHRWESRKRRSRIWSGDDGGAAWGLLHVFSGRAAYIHVGRSSARS